MCFVHTHGYRATRQCPHTQGASGSDVTIVASALTRTLNHSHATFISVGVSNYQVEQTRCLTHMHSS